MIEQIWQQATTQPSDINLHLPTLLALGRQVSHVTEFGVRGICSSWAWIKAEVKHIHLYDIVHPQDHPDPAVPPWTWKDYQALRPDAQFHLESTLECTIVPTELLFIDTLHTGPQLQQELVRHHQQVSKFIVLHDTETYGTQGEDRLSPGLDWALIPFVAQYPWRIFYRTPENNGLTVLVKR